jgi:DNA-binding NarL/FixJ family response regulator
VEIHEELSRKKYDMFLPTNNGLGPREIQALIPEIRKKHPGIKIIVLSGFSTPEFVRDLKEQGIDDFLSLPFPHDDLVQKVTAGPPSGGPERIFQCSLGRGLEKGR